MHRTQTWLKYTILTLGTQVKIYTPSTKKRLFVKISKNAYAAIVGGENKVSGPRYNMKLKLNWFLMLLGKSK